MSPGYGGEVRTASKRPPSSSSRASPWTTVAARPRSRARSDALVGVRVVVEQRSEQEELGGGAGREPVCDVAVRALPGGADTRESVTELVLEEEEVVAGGLDAHEQAVERRDVHAD